MIGYITHNLLYIALSGILNRTRGMDIISRTTFTIVNGLLCYVLYNDFIFALICSIGILIWLMRTWGKYFLAFMPSMDLYKNRKGVGFIDKFVDKVYKIPTNDKELINWGTIAMSLRGFVFIIPLFIGLSIYASNPYIILLSLPMLLQGLYYRFIKYYKFKYAEMMTGYTYSSLILISTMI